MSNTSYAQLEASFVAAGMPKDLADAVLTEYVEVKRRYYERDHKPGSVHGGRFCEAVARVLQHTATGTYTSLTDKLDFDATVNPLYNNKTLDDGLRLHTIRIMRFVYGVRNSRDNGHLKGGIDTNLQDATAVVSGLDWVLAELVRVYHSVSAEDANNMIRGIVTKEVPVIEVFDGRPVMHSDPAPMDLVLAFLYWSDDSPLTKSVLRSWLPARVNLGRELGKADTLHLVHVDGDKVYLTAPGRKYVENEKLLHPPSS